MSPRPRSAQSLESRCTRGTQSYRCRVCSGIHPLKKCRRFLRLSAEKRLRAVLVNRYCSSCLAHEHSDGSCRRGDCCRTCGQDHHSLLHLVEKPRSRRQPRQEEHKSRSAGDSTRSVSASARPSSANSWRGSVASRPSSANSRRISVASPPSSATYYLPQDFCQRWVDFLENYSVLDQIRVPRWVAFRPHLRVEHHGFCDASEKAYGAAIYVRVEGWVCGHSEPADGKDSSGPS
ncbi:uncharacterized protein LOC121530494 [Drosophila eugracilis]|uniref:uncharacterized protein LOC121530494 n=1 Tax=Drosophila eugracilis TaxID=29029 RepID=UPI001BD926C8|nr:uncharacterized protein LOC121530494 [Drosophila eugracilis]